MDDITSQPSIPLVRAVKGGFVLSEELIRIGRPLWSGWELHKFVAHLVGFFDDPYEHLLDHYPQDADLSVFDVSADKCSHLAKDYHSEFLPLPPKWYEEVFRAKLRSLRIPIPIVQQAKFAFLSQTFPNPQSIADELALLLANKGREIPQINARQIGHLPSDKAWMILEPEITRLINEGTLDDEDINDLFYSS